MPLSPYLLTIIISWVVAQGVKYAVVVAKSRSFGSFRHLYLSGNMPSAHSATVVSMATFVGLVHGFESALFGIAAMVAAVVMYDAVMVRRSVGEQGSAIQALIKLAKGEEHVVIPRSAKGHTPVEVLVGACLGMLIGVVVFMATK